MLIVALALTLVMLLVTELMYRLGRHARTRHDDSSRTQLMTVQAATLGLLALTLGFTLSMAESRFNTRRGVNLEEANAVRGTFLQTELLPEPEGSRSRALLADYVTARRAYFRASTDDAPGATARSLAISSRLWDHAMVAARAHPDWDVLATYVGTLADMIELEVKRDVSSAARLPGEIHVMLLVIALVALGITAFASGVAGARGMFSLYVVPLLVAFACVVVVDLDRSRFGFIRAPDGPMERVERLIDATQATR